MSLEIIIMVPSLSSGQCTLYTVQCPLPSTDLNFLSTFLVKEIRAFFQHFFPSSICLQIFSTSTSWNTKVLERGVNSNHLLACSLINSFVITVSWSSSQADQGQSCKIGNVPILEAKNIFVMFQILWWYFWYWFLFTLMETVKGQLKKISGKFFGQDLRFLCPRVTLPFLGLFSLSGPGS